MNRHLRLHWQRGRDWRSRVRCLVWRPVCERLEERALLSLGFPLAFALAPDVQINGAAMDSAGDIYVTGGFSGTVNFNPNGSAITKTSNGGNDIFVAKYAPSGQLAWVDTAGGPADDVGQAIAVDSAGNAFVTGFFSQTVNFNPSGSFNLTSPAGFAVFVWALNADGSFNWAAGSSSTNSLANDRGQGIAVDSGDNAYVIGNFTTTATFGTVTLVSGGQQDIFVAKLTKNNQSATWDWVTHAEGSANELNYGLGIAVNSSGSTVATTGQFTGTTSFFIGNSSFTKTSYGTNNQPDIYLWVLSGSSGTPTVIEQIGGTLYDQGLGIAMDSSGNIDLTGNFLGTVNFSPLSGTIHALTSPNSGSDQFVAQYDASGNYHWATDLGATTTSPGTAPYLPGAAGVATTSSTVYVTGTFSGTALLGGRNLHSSGGLDVFVATLNPATGAITDAAVGGGQGNLQGAALATPPSGTAAPAVVGDFLSSVILGTHDLVSSGSPNGFVATLGQVSAAHYTLADYDGDGKTDIAAYYPNTAQFFVALSGGGALVQAFGGPGFVPLEGDYDGDGKTDIAVYYSASSTFYILPSSGAPAEKIQFGPPGSIPLTGDYDGDGKTDIAVYSPTYGTFYIDPSNGANAYAFPFGGPGFIPLVGDWDGDGKTDIGVYDPTSGIFYIDPSNGANAYAIAFGPPGSIPLTGDYDGDGKTDIAVYSPTYGTFYIDPSNGANAYAFPFGGPGFIPLIGDFDGDGKTDIGAYYTTNSTYYIIPSSGNPPAIVMPFGAPGFIPLETTPDVIESMALGLSISAAQTASATPATSTSSSSVSTLPPVPINTMGQGPGTMPPVKIVPPTVRRMPPTTLPPVSVRPRVAQAGQGPLGSASDSTSPRTLKVIGDA